jgi:hypothetical protein
MTREDSAKIKPIDPLVSASRTLDAEIAGLAKLKSSLSNNFVTSVEMLAGGERANYHIRHGQKWTYRS